LDRVHSSAGCRRGSALDLCAEHLSPRLPGRLVRGSNPQRCPAGGFVSRSSYGVQLRRQFEDGEGHWPDDPSVRASSGRRGHPIRGAGLALTLVIAMCMAPVALRAQPRSGFQRIGVLGAASASTYGSFTDAFRHALRELGYVEGKNVTLVYRWADGRYDRLPE